MRVEKMSTFQVDGLIRDVVPMAAIVGQQCVKLTMKWVQQFDHIHMLRNSMRCRCYSREGSRVHMKWHG